MKLPLIVVAALLFGAFSTARADETTRAIQQSLKDQGFYYGDASGQKNSETTAAIRRFQIRNGLQITGEINAETLRALGVSSAPSATKKPIATATPSASAFHDTDAQNRADRSAPSPPQAFNSQRPPRFSGYAPAPHAMQPRTNGVFDETPYEIAPPDLQRHVIAGAQTLLARRGFYGSTIDGVFGPGTEFAVRAFQSRVGIPPSGQLDMETLAALGLLPGQHAPGIAVPPRRFERRMPRGLPY
jgi:peptidoglycan hydrolase-like protein with peptidoglycan-binding domain